LDHYNTLRVIKIFLQHIFLMNVKIVTDIKGVAVIK